MLVHMGVVAVCLAPFALPVRRNGKIRTALQLLCWIWLVVKCWHTTPERCRALSYTGCALVMLRVLVGRASIQGDAYCGLGSGHFVAWIVFLFSLAVGHAAGWPCTQLLPAL